MYKIEMYFGRDRPNERQVCDREFYDFIADCVIPRFPDGFTVLDGFGLWKNAHGKIIQEQCKILVLIIPQWENADTQVKVYHIRNSYCNRFNQESVLVTVSGLIESTF